MKRRPESARRPWDKRRGDFGHALRSTRRAQWLTLRDCAAVLGKTSANTLSRLERGGIASPEMYDHIADWIEAVKANNARVPDYSLTLRGAHISDADAITALLNEVRPERPTTRERILGHINSRNTRVKVVTTMGIVVGCSFATNHPASEHGPAHVYVDIVVSPASRGRGVGGQLLYAIARDRRPLRGRTLARDLQAVRTLHKAWGCEIQNTQPWGSELEHTHSRGPEPAEITFALHPDRMTVHLVPRIPSVRVSLLNCAEFKVISGALYGVYWRGWKEPHSLESTPPKPPWEWTETIANSLLEGGIIAVAFDQTTPVGFTWAIPQGPAMHIEFTTVQEHWRANGIAKTLKTALCAAAFTAGASRVLTECVSTNTAILATNAALGFDEIVNLEVTQHR